MPHALRSHALRLSLSVAAVLATALATGCTQPTEAPAEATASSSEALSCSPSGAGCTSEVQQIAAGQWQAGYSAPSGIRYGWFWDADAWIDIAVKNASYAKSVGIRWTTDGWATSHDTAATYEKSLTAPYEQWGVDLTPAAKMQSCFWCNPVAPKLEYAIYATLDGKTYWDNNGGKNYAITLRNTYGAEEALDWQAGVTCGGGALVVEKVAGTTDGSDFVATVKDPQAIDYFLQKSTESHVETQELYGQTRTFTVTSSMPYNMVVSGEGAARTMTIRGLRGASAGGYEAGQFLANLYASEASSLKLSVTNSLMTSSHSVVMWEMGSTTFTGCTKK